MVGVREPDLTRIQPGDPRSQAERMLGKRLWRPGSAEGLTYDVYQYEAGRPAEPLWGTAVLILDVYTLGMAELPAADARKFAPVKQVAVAYDEQDRVRLVSQPWQVPGGTFEPCRRMRSVLPADSGVPSTAHPSPTDRPPGVALEVAILELDSPIHATIDGRKVEGSVVELPPGRHTVDYQASLGGSVMYGATVLSRYGSAEVELLPGRLYRLKHKRFYGWPRKRADIFWIEDVDSGETLHCA
jgi:hypothetical protein